MQKNTQKQNLVQIQLRYPFDLPILAQQAGLETRIVYHALLQQPISLQDTDYPPLGALNTPQVTQFHFTPCLDRATRRS